MHGRLTSQFVTPPIVHCANLAAHVRVYYYASPQLLDNYLCLWRHDAHSILSSATRMHAN